MKISVDPQEIWREYQRAREYKERIGLYRNVRINENFYIGRQWEGLDAPDLPKPVLNFLKRVVNFCAASIVSDDIAVYFTPNEPGLAQETIARALAKRVEQVFERTDLRSLNRDALRNALVDGDACMFLRFDPDVKTGEDAQRDIVCELVDNVNVCFANPYQADPQKQPYILVARRMPVEELLDEAEKYGLSAQDRALIRPDGDTTGTTYSAEDDGMATRLTKLFFRDGTVHCVETTQRVTLRREFDTEYTRYPIAWMSWDKVKNSYHGQAILTGLIPNQIQVNRLFAMSIRSVEMNAFPKIIYDPARIRRWTNRAGEAIAATGGAAGVNGAVTSIRGADISPQVMEIIRSTVNMTRDFMGATDTVLGNVRPENTSAILALQRTATVPLELHRLSFYRFVEDIVRIMLDIMRADYGKRRLILDDADAQRLMADRPYVEFDFSSLDSVNYRLSVDVGASSYWSEAMQLQTMDNLFMKGLVRDAETYIQSIPSKYLRNKEKLLQSLRSAGGEGEGDSASVIERKAALAQMQQGEAGAESKQARA